MDQTPRPGAMVAVDYLPLRKLLIALLTGAGYPVTPVADGETALATLLASAQPLIVLLSLWRCRLRSRDILTAAADTDPLRRHAYILLTANWDGLPGEYRTLLDDLSVPLVPKPFQLDALLRIVDQASDRLARGGIAASA